MTLLSDSLPSRKMSYYLSSLQHYTCPNPYVNVSREHILHLCFSKYTKLLSCMTFEHEYDEDARCVVAVQCNHIVKIVMIKVIMIPRSYMM